MNAKDVILTSLEDFDEFDIIHKDIIYSNVVLGANLFKDMMAGITDALGGRSSSYEGTLDEGMKKANIELQKRAAKLGANAVVRVDYKFNSMGKNSTILSVHAHGTAVLLKEKN